MSFFPPAPRGRGAPRGNGHIHGFHPYGRGRGRGFGYDEYQAPAPPPTPLAAKPAKLKPVEINGIKFRLILNGSKLKRITRTIRSQICQTKLTRAQHSAMTYPRP